MPETLDLRVSTRFIQQNRPKAGHQLAMTVIRCDFVAQLDTPRGGRHVANAVSRGDFIVDSRVALVS